MGSFSSVIIRPFLDIDQEAVHGLILSGLAEHFDELEPSLNQDLDNITSNYIARGHSFVVAVAGGRIIGSGALLCGQKKEGRIVRISVSVNHRRKGIGRAIIRHLLHLAQSLGLHRIHVETNADWSSAIAMYESCHFKRVSQEDGYLHLVREL